MRGKWDGIDVLLLKRASEARKPSSLLPSLHVLLHIFLHGKLTDRKRLGLVHSQASLREKVESFSVPCSYGQGNRRNGRAQYTTYDGRRSRYDEMGRYVRDEGRSSGCPWTSRACVQSTLNPLPLSLILLAIE